MEPDQSLRPLERRVLRLLDEGQSAEEIARRFRRSPDLIRRVIDLTAIDRPGADAQMDSEPLRPLERRILRWRDEGSDYREIGERFRRSPDAVERIEGLANYKLARG